MSFDDQAPESIQIHPISGTWFNELGSKVILTANEDGSLVGTYCSAVGDAEYFYDLTGRFDTAPPSGKGTSIGWTVTWRNETGNANSTTTWSGQYFSSPTPQIVTQWLLTRSTDPKSVWNSTNLGHDEFTRSVGPYQAANTASVRPTYASNFPPIYATDA